MVSGVKPCSRAYHAPPRSKLTLVRVCTYNCMNLFAWTAEPQEPVNPAKPALEDINTLLKRPFPVVQLAETNSNRGIHLGFMSRYPMHLHSHRELPLLDETHQPLSDLASPTATEYSELKLQRDIAVAELEVANQPPVFAANLHLKSAGKRPWQTLSPLTVRTAECQVLADVIRNYQIQVPDSPLLIMGDFNDNPTSSAFAALDNLPAGTLFDPLMRELVPANPRLSTYWPKRRTRIDRILLNEVAKQSYQLGSIRLWGNKRAEVASDHFPLSIDLRMDKGIDAENTPEPDQ